MWLPHDAQAKSLGTGRSIEELARNAGWRVRIVPKLSVADGINAVRTLFPTMWFDRERCAVTGMTSIRTQGSSRDSRFMTRHPMGPTR